MKLSFDWQILLRSKAPLIFANDHVAKERRRTAVCATTKRNGRDAPH
jgi:hypothetical protein